MNWMHAKAIDEAIVEFNVKPEGTYTKEDVYKRVGEIYNNWFKEWQVDMISTGKIIPGAKYSKDKVLSMFKRDRQWSPSSKNSSIKN